MVIDTPKAIFLGFCMKEYWATPPEWRRPGWAEHVEEVCSAGDCIATRPPGWIDRWDFNRAYCWDTESGAEDCVPADKRDQYRLYAFRAIPLVFGKSGPPQALKREELFEPGLPDLPDEPDLSDFEFLGYDAVEYAGYANYGCSPLSCNGEGGNHPVNRYCLLDSLESAMTAARAFGIEEPEPGPYIILEVLRRKTDPPQS